MNRGRQARGGKTSVETSAGGCRDPLPGLGAAGPRQNKTGVGLGQKVGSACFVAGHVQQEHGGSMLCMYWVVRT